MPTDPNFLRSYTCFRNLTDAQLSSIAEITSAVCYPAGYVLFEEGKPGERIYFLAKGKVEVSYNIGEAGNVRVDTVSNEEIVGCSALVEPFRYTATESALTEVEVLEIDAAALRELMQRDLLLGYAIQQQIINVLMMRIVDLRLGSAS